MLLTLLNKVIKIDGETMLLTLLNKVIKIVEQS